MPRLTPLAVHKPLSALTVTVGGQLIVGAWLSITITSCVQLALFALGSVAVQSTRLVPTGKLLGALLTKLAPQLSLTVAIPSATPVATHWPGFAFVITFAGQLIVGGLLSRTVTIAVQVLLLPH